MGKLETRRSSFITAAVLAVGVVSAGCVDKVDTSLKSCPCADGNVCCDSGVCASELAGCTAATAALSASVQGRWAGYIENFRPDVPEDRIAITMVSDANGNLSGELVFGVVEPPPVASDPDLPWPPQYTALQTTFVQGFRYAARDINWQARRLKLRIKTYAPWEGWCALQTQTYPNPILDSGSPYTCAPPTDSQEGDRCWHTPDPSDPATQVEFSCQKASLCYEMCVCDADSCAAVDDQFFALDLAFQGAEAEGSISVHANYNLRLTRVPGSVAD
jgi:hypothetical protein